MPKGICETNINNGCSAENKLKRNNYFSGKKLDVDSFNAEQNYFINKIRTLSAQTNGSGVINGLKIDKISGSKITLNAGAAVDACGNLLMLYKQRVFELDNPVKADAYIYLQYVERGSDKVPRHNSDECSDECCDDRIEEDMQIIVESELLTAPPAEICNGGKVYSSAKKALVLLGVYRSNGGIDYSGVVYLHKNSELSKRVCEISQKYVSSVNGTTGDVSAVSSINNAVPSGNGQINFEGGNNISLESSGNTVTISAQNGFYGTHNITLEKGASTSIEHNCRRYPVVDVYRKIQIAGMRFEAVHIDELNKMAKDTIRHVDEIVKEMSAKTFDDFTLEYNEQNNASGKKILSKTSNITLDSALRIYEVEERSIKISKMSDQPISRIRDKIYIRPKYAYQKVVGSADPDMNVTVIHSSFNSVSLRNNGAAKISLLVILST